jgi:hypothetical protein
VNLEGFTVVFFFLTGMRRMVSWVRRWRMVGHNNLACATPLGGGPDNILSFLRALLPSRIHA